MKLFWIASLVFMALQDVAVAQWMFSPRNHVHSYAPREQFDRGGNFDFPFFAPREEDKPTRKNIERPAQTNSYCVRTCDGRYFPVSRTKQSTPEKLCSALCPAAKIRIFSGPEIEKAFAADGTKYMSLPTALAYRTRIVPDCSCNGKDVFGLAKPDLENDLTLRSGDIVVRTKDIVVFQGGSLPYKSTNFLALARAGGLSPQLRKQLLATKILPNNPNTNLAITVSVRQTSPERTERIVTPNVVPTPTKISDVPPSPD